MKSDCQYLIPKSWNLWEYFLMAIMSNEARDTKLEPTESLFRGSKSLERDIGNLTLYLAPR